MFFYAFVLFVTGEPLTPEILAECIEVLTKKSIAETKENLTALDFSRDILGFEETTYAEDEAMAQPDADDEGNDRIDTGI